MNQPDPNSLLAKLKDLPARRLAEVEHFVDFLRGRDEDRRLIRTAAQATHAGFAKVWDNDDDAEYDRL